MKNEKFWAKFSNFFFRKLLFTGNFRLSNFENRGFVTVNISGGSWPKKEVLQATNFDKPA